MVHLQSRLDQRVAQLQFGLKTRDSQRLSRCGRGNGKLHARLQGCGTGVADVRLNANLTRFPIGPDKEIFNPGLRNGEHFDGVPDAPLVPRAAGPVRQRLVSVWRLVQDNAVHWLVRRVQHANSQPIRLARLDDVGHIEHKHRLAPFVRSDRRIVEPHIALVINLPETQQRTPILVVRWRDPRIPSSTRRRRDNRETRPG